MNTGTNESSALAIITPDDLQTANGVLQANAGYVAKYKATHSKLMEEAKKAGEKLPPELDGRISAFLTSASTAVKKMEADRKPFTQKAQDFVKLFTNEENTLKNELMPPLQTIRNNSAAIYQKEDEQKRKEEEAQLLKDQEKITLLADAEQQVRNAYSDILANDKALLLATFEGATLESIDEIEAGLKGIQGVFAESEWNGIKPILTSKILSDEELSEILIKSKEGKFEKVTPHYKTEIINYVNTLLTLIPNRRNELAEGIAESEAAEKLKQEQREMDAANQAAIDAQVEQSINSQLHQANINVKITQANRAAEKPRAIEGYEITVKTREGWMEIFKFYFAHSTEQDLGKIKGDQMKAFAEKYAKSNGVFIQSPPNIEYATKYKALAVKTNPKVKVQPDQVPA